MIKNKVCSKCLIDQPFSSFSKRTGRGWGSSWCLKCHADWNAEDHKKNPQKRKAKWAAYYKKNSEHLRARSAAYQKSHKKHYENHRLMKAHGLTEKQYERMYKTQIGGCAICQGVNLNGRRLYVDHDHVTGTIRGLLCEPCNLMIGNAKDKISTLLRAADYLEAPKRVCGGFV